MTIDLNNNMGVGTNSPEITTILETSSTSKGARFSPMTFVQMMAIVSPADGLYVYVVDAQVKAYFTFNSEFGKWTAPEYNILNNNNGSALVQGDVVRMNTSANFSVLTTTEEGDPEVVGVVVIGGGDDSTDVLIKYGGEVIVNKVAGVILVADFLFSSTTAGKAEFKNTGGIGDFGVALENTTNAQVRMLFTVSTTD